LQPDGFDFIQGLDLGFHLSKAKISSWYNHDFIKPTEKERTVRLEFTDLFSLSVCNMGLSLARLHLTAFLKFSAKNITHWTLFFISRLQSKNISKTGFYRRAMLSLSKGKRRRERRRRGS
jgi:hypothetical protein